MIHSTHNSFPHIHKRDENVNEFDLFCAFSIDFSSLAQNITNDFVWCSDVYFHFKHHDQTFFSLFSRSSFHFFFLQMQMYNVHNTLEIHFFSFRFEFEKQPPFVQASASIWILNNEYSNKLKQKKTKTHKNNISFQDSSYFDRFSHVLQLTQIVHENRQKMRTQFVCSIKQDAITKKLTSWRWQTNKNNLMHKVKFILWISKEYAHALIIKRYKERLQ